MCPLRLLGFTGTVGTHVSQISHVLNARQLLREGRPVPVNWCTQSANTVANTTHQSQKGTLPFQDPPWLECQKHQGFSLLVPYGKDWNYCGVYALDSSNAGGALPHAPSHMHHCQAENAFLTFSPRIPEVSPTPGMPYRVYFALENTRRRGQ